MIILGNLTDVLLKEDQGNGHLNYQQQFNLGEIGEGKIDGCAQLCEIARDYQLANIFWVGLGCQTVWSDRDEHGRQRRTHAETTVAAIGADQVLFQIESQCALCRVTWRSLADLQDTAVGEAVVEVINRSTPQARFGASICASETLRIGQRSRACQARPRS